MKKVKTFLRKKELKIITSYLGLIFLGILIGMNNKNLIDYSKRALAGKAILDETVTPRQLGKALENKDFKLINVHTPYEGEIEKTDFFVDYDMVVANEDKLPEDKNEKIVLYCKSGNMSLKALRTLRIMGYTNVSHLVGGMDAWEKEGGEIIDLSNLSSAVIPLEGLEIPISYGDLGGKMVEVGVIDLNKFSNLMDLTKEQNEIFYSSTNQNIIISEANSRFVVNFLWALGLAQKSIVYEEGPMGKEGDVGNFASTGGWTLARGEAVNYLNKFDLIGLNPDEQKRVEEIVKNIYRPCCGNSTWFPDCNHGMAALAAVELMVKNGLTEDEIYRNVLKLNSFWFPDTYIKIATYFARQGIPWNEIDAKLVLGEEFSSAKGAAELSKIIEPLPRSEGGGGSCGA